MASARAAIRNIGSLVADEPQSDEDGGWNAVVDVLLREERHQRGDGRAILLKAQGDRRPRAVAPAPPFMPQDLEADAADLGLGVIGQYMARMYDEIKGRPVCLISRVIGLDTNADTHQ